MRGSVAACRLGIARTFQNVRLFHEMTVLENVLVGMGDQSFVKGSLRLPGTVDAERLRMKRAYYILEDVGLEKYLGSRAGDIPFGQQRLLEIARALALDPKLLLLDEPAAGLNRTETTGLGALIRRIRDKGKTVLLVEHDMHLVMNLVEKVIVLDGGRKIAKAHRLMCARTRGSARLIWGRRNAEDDQPEVRIRRAYGYRWDLDARRQGEVVALLGGNGAGKSTLLKTIAGLITPTAGRIALRDRNITGWPAEKIAAAGLSLVPEGRGLFPGMSVLDNLRMGGYASRLAGRKLSGRIEQAYEMFPVLAERLSDKAGNLSGGQQQMLAIARALVGSPDILLLDEPSTGLAPLLVAEVFEKIQQLKESGMTILLAEQNVQMALETADRAYVIENGKVVFNGPASELMESDEVKRAYLGI